MGAGYHGGFGATSGSIDYYASFKVKQESDDSLINELKRNHVKFTEKDIVFITRDKTGQIVWLETGNRKAGLIHILDGKDGHSGHAKDFENAFGVKRNEVAMYLKEVIQKGTVISNRLVALKSGGEGYERVYEHGGSYYILYGIGTNGFISSAYPIRKKGKHVYH